MDSKQERMRVEFAEDKSTVTLSFLPASGVTGTMTLTAGQLLELVKGLGKVHATMGQGVEMPTLEGTLVEAVFNTRWFVHPEMVGEASALSFHHPSFGPLGFLLPIDQAEHLARLLNAQVDMARASKSGKPQ